MQLTAEEIKYLVKCLDTTSSYTRAQAEQIETPSVDHLRLVQKLKAEEYKLRM
jgi:hypothetical protein